MSDSARGQTPRRRLSPGDGHKHRELALHPPVLAVARASPVAPPNLPVQPTRPRVAVVVSATFIVCGAVQLTGRLGGLVPSRSHVPPPRPVANLAPRECPRAARARRLAPSARASLRAASVRFTPSRAPSLSPRRAPLLARRFPRPHPSAVWPAAPLAPAQHRGGSRSRRKCRTSLRRRRTATNRADRRRRQGLRHPAALTPSPIGACGVV